MSEAPRPPAPRPVGAAASERPRLESLSIRLPWPRLFEVSLEATFTL